MAHSLIRILMNCFLPLRNRNSPPNWAKLTTSAGSFNTSLLIDTPLLVISLRASPLDFAKPHATSTLRMPVLSAILNVGAADPAGGVAGGDLVAGGVQV